MRLFTKNIKQKPIILVFRIGQLGDTLVAMPAIWSIREKYPHHKLVLITDKHDNSTYVSSWDILRPTGWFDDVIYYKTGSVSAIRKLKSLANLGCQLRSYKADILYDLSPLRSRWQALRDHIFFKMVVGCSRYCCYGENSNLSKNPDGTMPRMQPEWQRLISIVGETKTFSFPIPLADKIQALGLLKNAEIPPKKLIAIGPGSKMSSKMWPIEYFAKLGSDLLKKKSDIYLLVLGGKEDEEIGNILCDRWGLNCHNFAGKMSIYVSAALMQHCSLYIGNDTGTMHLAGMVNIPCVIMFSARDYPGKWDAFGENNINIRKDVSCSGCMLECCTKNNECMKLISVEEVSKAATNLL